MRQISPGIPFSFLEKNGPLNIPSPAIVIFRAICFIQAASGARVKPPMQIPSRGNPHEYQHVVRHQSVGRSDLRCEEIDCGQYCQMRSDEIFPEHSLASFRCWGQAVAFQDVGYGFAADLVPLIFEGAHNSLVAPSAVVPGHFQHHSFERLGKGRPRAQRFLVPSNFLATSFRCQARRVSGLTICATSSSAFRPNCLPISARLMRSSLFRCSRPLSWFLRIRFSVARYSLRSNSS